jgi:hypothetical protein
MGEAADIALSNSPASAMSLSAARVGSKSAGLGIKTAFAPEDLVSVVIFKPWQPRNIKTTFRYSRN